jgi:hypothetical protein
MLTLEALKDYRNWVGETVSDVHYSVIRVGGWQNVFPGALPRWASRIRQYFNLTPMTLKRLDDEESRQHCAKAQTAPRAPTLRGRIGTKMALSDYVYEDVQVNLATRIVMDSVSQGSYNYAETIVKGLPAHERLDVNTDPMKPGYYVEPPNLFQFSELYMRRFPENDREGKSLVDQSGPAP